MRKGLFIFILMTMLILASTGVLFALEKPVLEKYVQPEYPLSLLKRDIEGKVVVQLEIDKFGLVKNMKIKESSGFESFDKAALKAISSWKYKRLNNKITASVPVKFVIE